MACLCLFSDALFRGVFEGCSILNLLHDYVYVYIYLSCENCLRKIPKFLETPLAEVENDTGRSG